MNPQDVSAHSSEGGRWAVLDTQAVLDWLYFTDPTTRHWEAWRQQGLWRWAVSAAMRDELAHVLGRGQLPAAQGLSAEALLACLGERAMVLSQPAARLANGLRCTDPDDQKFLDFAVAHRVTWLVSRDRAVLKLRRRALASHGVQILPPSGWTPATTRA